MVCCNVKTKNTFPTLFALTAIHQNLGIKINLTRWIYNQCFFLSLQPHYYYFYFISTSNKHWLFIIYTSAWYLFQCNKKPLQKLIPSIIFYSQHSHLQTSWVMAEAMSLNSRLKKQIRLFVGSLKGGQSIRERCDDAMHVRTTSRDF